MVHNDAPAQGEERYSGHRVIKIWDYDVENDKVVPGTDRIIVNGGVNIEEKPIWIEAPHIYFENGWYYLMVAEGGTFTNHCVMMARCRTVDGDYEICPRNPIVTHRHLSLEHEISVTGHADIVQTQKGEWWMVLLAVRPYQNAHFNLGRVNFYDPGYLGF